MQVSQGDITELLRRVQSGDHEARSRLVSLVYGRLGQLARHRALNHGPRSLQTSELIHEMYLKLLAPGRHDWKDRGHFFAVASTAMRQVLVDRARARRAQRRGGGVAAESIEAGAMPAVTNNQESMLAVDEALNRLAAFDERQARIVDMIFFGGFTESEVAEALSINVRTVQREWRAARLWLAAEIAGDGAQRA